MTKTTDNFDKDVEAELEELRQSMGLQKSKPENLVNALPQNPINAVPRQKKALLLAAIGILVVGGVTVPAVFKAQQSLLEKSQAIIVEGKSISNNKDVNFLKNVKQNLKETIARLERIPNVPGLAYQEAQADLPKLRSLLESLEQNLKAAENIKAAENLAMEAAILVKNPPHPLEVWQQAQAKWQQAIALLESIPSTNTFAVGARSKLSAYRSNQAVISKRVALAQQAVDFNNQGNSALGKGDYGRSVKYFTHAITLNANLADAYVGRGIAYSEQGNNQKAIQEYEQAIKLNTNFADAYFNRGLSNFKLGNKQKAVEDLDRAIGVNPNYAIAYLERGALRYHMGVHAQAVDDFHKAAELFSKQGDTENQQVAQSLINKFQVAVEETPVATNNLDTEKCWDAWGKPCDRIERNIYVHSRQPKSRSTNIQNDSDKDTTSIRSASRSRGGSFRSRSKRR